MRTLVNNAPATLPKLPQDCQNPIIVPLPFLPNQFANIELQHGHPSDYTNPFIANSAEKKIGLVQFFSPQYEMTDVITVTAI